MKSTSWMKSLRDEICLAAGDGGGFNFILGGTPKISSERSEDFIAHRAISFFLQLIAIHPKVCYNNTGKAVEK